MKEKLAVTGVMCVLAFIIHVLLLWGDCAWYGYQTNRDTRYAAFVGCMVKKNEHWVPRSELRSEGN